MRYAPIEIRSSFQHKFWGTSTLIAKTEAYMGSVNRYRAGQSGALQYHTRKHETLYLFSGEAVLWWGDDDKNLRALTFVPGLSFQIPPGTVHKVVAITDCVIFEVSTPHTEDRVNVEHEYKDAIG